MESNSNIRNNKDPGTVILRYGNFNSRYVSSRNIDILLPPGYKKNNHYPVIYMHDGQNLFDPETSFAGVDWGVDEALNNLLRKRKIRAAIIVAIWNTPARMTEYMPAKAYSILGREEKKSLCREYKKTFNVNLEPVLSDNYLKFIVHELKPFIDSNFATLEDSRNTFIMGSSMGGLISIYALSEYPEIFGGAACLSTHWTAGNGVVIQYLKDELPEPGIHKIYFDFGTRTIDQDYEPFQHIMNQVMKFKGYTQGKDWLTLKFPGAEHSEQAWRNRIEIPLHFFLEK